mmetsp:Transcript_23556/g.48250  ORF Transcript_23556/g.48250 Transcript_23556/m.48250 type:complete len:270 (+) Transcript_23556:98-907(+)
MFIYNHNDPFGHFYGTPMTSAREQQRLRQELARRQHIREMERRKLAEIEWRRRMEAKMAMEEEERKRRKLREMEFIERQRRIEKDEEERRRSLFSDRVSCDNEFYYSPGTIVRGPDGRLYRFVSAPSSTPAKEKMEEGRGNGTRNSIFQDDANNHRCVSDSDDDESSVSSEEEQSHSLSGIENDDESATSETFHNSEEDENEAPETATKEGQLANAQEITSSNVPSVQLIPVEDVPDEEDDELRELRSIWRNRMPSEGQWMEPVEVIGK